MLYTLYNFHQLILANTIIFAVVAIVMQLGVNVWNNLVDYRTNGAQWSAQSVNNSIQGGAKAERRAWLLLVILIGIAILGGIWLVSASSHGLTVLILGLVGALVAFWYSGSSIPLSRIPFGEAASGITMGFVIFLAVILVNNVTIDLNGIAGIALTSLVAVTSISNIMLSNNLSDHQEDEREGRHTLVHYLGVHQSLLVYTWLYVIGYLAVILAIGVGVLPWSTVIVLLTIPIVGKNIRAFWALQSKRETFVLAIKNAVLITAALAIGLLIGIIFKL
jgi:1,4-dihydroxy-2-naphthoate octaprenyltransferase